MERCLPIASTKMEAMDFSATSVRALGVGAIHRFEGDSKQFHHEWNLGTCPGLRRFVALYRHEPFWMRPAYGDSVDQAPADVQWMFLELEDGRLVMLAPIIDGGFRASLHGTPHGLILHADSGDPAVVASAVDALYVIEGTDPHAMTQIGATELAKFLGIPLRTEKPVPSFVDLFGWCTWDAFYRGVDPSGVRAGLESLRDGGSSPAFVILDDGWQSTGLDDLGEEILTSFRPNAKFAGDLSATVRMAKEEFGVRTFLVWHAMNGYWGGAKSEEFDVYDVRPVARRYAPGILRNADARTWWKAGIFAGAPASEIGVAWLVPPRQIDRFFSDYHRGLRAQGVDGVKVDNQAALEALGEGSGGRVALMKRYREALEGSIHAHFGGALINCMSCSTDMLYSARASTVVRSSDDFYPNSPDTHGRHVVTNALFGLWFGRFMTPDWDMFHSDHAAGQFHGAARAISGGPVYVSDKPGRHDHDLIHRLVLADGVTPRALAPGVPTADSLFQNVLAGEGPIKVVTQNAANAIVGAFHCHYDAKGEARTVTGSISAADVPGWSAKRTVLYRDSTGDIQPGPVEVALGALECELVTISEVIDGFAVVGLTRLLNPGGAVAGIWRDGGDVYLRVRAGGELVAYCEWSPRSVDYGESVEIPFRIEGSKVKITIPDDARDVIVVIRR